MVPRKGIETVIRGFACLLRDHHITAKLVIVGGETDDADPSTTPEIARLQGIAREEGVEEHITFVGRRGRDTLKYYYSAADVFLTTPWYEPFGITPVEAMACGTPVVALRAGAVPEVVADGVTGIICDEPADLARAMHDVTHMSPAACRAHVVANFGVENLARGYENAYRAAMRIQRATRPSPRVDRSKAEPRADTKTDAKADNVRPVARVGDPGPNRRRLTVRR
jgi:glycosyltransferase involved in cell wall biosynthesis